MRKQTVFLTIALICMVASLVMPIVYFSPATMGLGRIMNCCFVMDEGHVVSVAPIGLLVVSAITCPVMLWAAFARKRLLGNDKVRVPNRRLQSRLCMVAVVLLIAWYGYCAGVVFAIKGADTPRPQFAAILPLLALILTLMARHGIEADEKLVRSADRLR